MSLTNALYLPQEEFEQPNFKHHFPQETVVEPPPAPDLMVLENLDIMALESPNWISLKWKKRTPFTINPGEVPSPQTDFPLKIEGTIPALIGASQDELVFASIDNIPLKHEIDEFDTITGHFIAWTKKPLVDNNNIIYAYYDNPSAIDKQDSPATWSNEFVVVQHMNETSGTIFDSTKFKNDMSKVGFPTNTTLIGNAKDFPLIGSHGYIISANDSLNTTNMGVSAWIKLRSALLGVIATKSQFPSDADWIFAMSADELFISIENNSSIMAGDLLPNVLYYVTIDIIGTTTFNVTINGDLVHTQTINPKPTSSISSLEFANLGGSTTLDGIGDEFHMSNNGKSVDWRKTEYNNQKPDGNTFFTIGAEESAPTTFDRMALEVTA